MHVTPPVTRGLKDDVVLPPGPPAGSAARPSRKGTACNLEAAEFIAAHEIGHVTLGHTSPRARLRIRLLVVGTIATFLMAGAAAGVSLMGWPDGLG